jgi:ATP-dependent Clp protease ATP-binding subunit ClpC
MFERFTDSATRAIVNAQGEAKSLNHDWVGTEHILLGVMGQECGGVGLLEARGVEVQTVREHLKQAFGVGDEQPQGHISFTAGAKEALKLSLQEALQLDHDYIGPEHLLLGTLLAGDGGAVQVLTELQVNVGELAREVRLQISASA